VRQWSTLSIKTGLVLRQACDFKFGRNWNWKL
jgi:hypothetical protein